MGPYTYKLVGKEVVPCSLDEAARLFSNFKNRRIAYTELPNGSSVSTVFLFFDHNFSSDSKDRPLVFESMVFQAPDSVNAPLRELRMERYHTYDEALAGHEKLVQEFT